MKKLSTLLALASFNLAAFAATVTFDFKDPQGKNNVEFKTVAPAETITGTATNVSGTVTFDPASPGSLKGKIVVAAKSMHVPNGMMQTHLHSATWLDVDKFPEISFETTKVENVKTEGDKTTCDLTGMFMLHGVAKEITAKGVAITYQKDKLKQLMPNLQGDLLVIKASFIVKRGDFGINAGKNEDKVANDINLTLNIAGMSPK
jgi:polyisoprenoid-binding protein YceI